MTETMTPGELVADLKELGSSVGDDLTKVMRATSLELLSSLMLATPVDLDRARSNWLTSVDSIDTSVQEPKYNAVGQAQSNLPSAKYNSVIFITNNVPYVQYLNQGSSKQAPAGFIETSIDLVSNEIPTIARQVFR